MFNELFAKKGNNTYTDPFICNPVNAINTFTRKLGQMKLKEP